MRLHFLFFDYFVSSIFHFPRVLVLNHMISLVFVHALKLLCYYTKITILCGAKYSKCIHPFDVVQFTQLLTLTVKDKN
jgi:hypothetical protein